MLKTYWPMLALIVVLVAVLGVSCYTYPGNEGEDDSATKGSLTITIQHHPNEGARKANHAANAKLWIVKTTAWPEGVTALLVILTLICITWQSCETRKSADSSLNSARAQMDANRAYFLVHVVKPHNLLTPISGLGEKHRTEVVFRNFGNTPAKIKGYRFELQIGESMEEPPNFSVMQDFYMVKDAHIVPPGQPFTFDAILNGDQETIILEDIAALSQRRKYLWLCGYVGYFDAFKRGPFETLACYLYLVPPEEPSNQFVMAGPPGHNECT